VFERRNPGFDIIIGNPPYEILSVKESGMARRKMEQDYFRRFYRGCSGKINLYRLMLERALNLLRDGGVLGFILPGTLLGDSGAKRIREELFESGKVLEALIIPEKARIFRGVTQALLILIVRKGAGTNHIRPSYLAGKKWGQFSPAATISRNLIELCGHRVPLLESEEEKRLLERISKFPPMRGDQEYEPIGRARQGEINMTANRAHITEHPTNYPLIRGEHVKRFLVCHPSSRPGRFDWVKEDYARLIIEKVGDDKPWLTERVVLARAVNMASRVRLKAARIKPYQFQGDMTNCLYGLRIDMDFLLGLLNSDLLNWRFRKTSANNYVSMAEVMALPVPRPAPPWVEPDTGAQVKALIGDLHRVPPLTMDGYKELVSPLSCGADGGRSALIEIIREASIFLRDRMKDEGAGKIQRLLNLSVCDYYGVVEFADMLEK
jgi:Alw26I/Eco31I/Esp3I family type II restriction m6 adenine DNA methyltransferase